MLASLAIRDVVLIEKLDLSFDAGLAVLTGETGAGKSILLDSLGLALGYLFATDRDNYSDTIYWGIFGTGFVLNIHHAGLARKELNKTIYFYNTEF